MFFYLALNLHELYLTLLGICFLVFVLICIIVIVSFLKYRLFLKTKKWETIINNKIKELITEENSDNDSSFKNLLNNKNFRNLCIQKIIETEKKFSGAIHETLHRFYDECNFKSDSIKKLSDSNYYVIAKGIQELTAMKVKEALPKIESLIHHRKQIVYQEVQYSIVRFQGFNGLYFLDNFKRILSDWQQLRLLQAVSEVPEEKINSLKKWLTSENTSIVIFTLKLISKFQMISLYPEVIKLFNDNNLKIQKEVLFTIQMLENEKTLMQLTEAFENKEAEVKLVILKVIHNLRDKESIPFLKEQLIILKEVNLKILIAEILYSFGEITFLKDLSTSSNQSEELVKIINHALQEKVC